MALYERPANLFVAGFLGSPAMNVLEGELQAADGLRLVLDGQGNDVPLPGAEVPSAWLGRRITLGVRPEHLLPAAEGLQARVEVVEPIGSEAFLHLDFAGRALVSRLPPQALPEPGAQVRLRADPAHLHFFDPRDGMRLAA